MSGRYELSPRARDDLARIVEWNEAEHGASRADRVWATFARQFELLAVFPRVGHTRPDLLELPWIRYWPVHEHLVLYVHVVQPIYVARILPGTIDGTSLRRSMLDDFDVRGFGDRVLERTSPYSRRAC